MRVALFFSLGDKAAFRLWRRREGEWCLKRAHHPSTLDKLHIRWGHAVGNGKGKKDRAVWAPVSHCQNNGLFKSLASELAVGHQERKELTVPLRTPSFHKGQKCQLSLPSGCLSATLVPWGTVPYSLFQLVLWAPAVF